METKNGVVKSGPQSTKYLNGSLCNLISLFEFHIVFPYDLFYIFLYISQFHANVLMILIFLVLMLFSFLLGH